MAYRRSRIANGLVAGLLAGLFLVTGRGTAAPAAPAARGLVCEEAAFDFGEMPNDRAVKHVFRLKNEGADVVRILNVRAGCGCMTAQPGTNAAAAGQSIDLSVVMDLKGRQGAQRKAVYVETDSLETPRLRLELRGTAVPEIDVQPIGVHFGTVGRTGVVEREVILTGRTGLTFHVTGVESRSSQFSAEAETVEVGHRYKIRIQCLEPRAAGSWAATLQVQTDHPTFRSIGIPVGVLVAGDIVAVPPSLYLVSSPATNTQVQFLTLYSPSSKPFKLGRIDVPSPALSLSVSNVAPDRYRIEVGARGNFEGLDGKAIRIATDVETEKEIRVPLRVVAGLDENTQSP